MIRNANSLNLDKVYVRSTDMRSKESRSSSITIDISIFS